MMRATSVSIYNYLISLHTKIMYRQLESAFGEVTVVCCQLRIKAYVEFMPWNTFSNLEE